MALMTYTTFADDGQFGLIAAFAFSRYHDTAFQGKGGGPYYRTRGRIPRITRKDGGTYIHNTTYSTKGSKMAAPRDRWMCIEHLRRSFPLLRAIREAKLDGERRWVLAPAAKIGPTNSTEGSMYIYGGPNGGEKGRSTEVASMAIVHCGCEAVHNTMVSV